MSRKSADMASRQELIGRLLYLGQMQSTETAHFHQVAAAANGVNITDSKALSVLKQEGSMTAGQLAVRLSLTTGAITSVIDRLELDGFVQRGADPDDRRKVVVSFNHQAAHKLSGTYQSMSAAFQELLSGYTDEQLRFLVQFFQASIELSRQETQKLTRH
ncbi:MAG TPA: MarR family transcriptional regulator [Candidatus Saccharimonadales bacterium]|nr:MarR family transcriptional regulator [Candidatus Saccharimonadales bacterium]